MYVATDQGVFYTSNSPRAPAASFTGIGGRASDRPRLRMSVWIRRGHSLWAAVEGFGVYLDGRAASSQTIRKWSARLISRRVRPRQAH